MAMNPVVQLALLRAIEESNELERQLQGIANNKPLLRMFSRMKEDAGRAIAAMVTLDLTDEPAKVVRNLSFLQQEVKIYERFVEQCQQIVTDGKDADSRITDEDREVLTELLAQDPSGEDLMMRLGLIEGQHVD